MIEVEGPDGSITEFPDGTPDAVISKAMSTHFGAPKPTEATAPASPGIVSRIGDAVSGALSRGERALGFGDQGPTPYQQSSDLDAQMRGVAPAPISAKPVEGGERRDGFLPAVAGVADQGVRGLAQGVASMAGLPSDVNALVLNMLPGMPALRSAMGLEPQISKPFLGSSQLKGALDTANDATYRALNENLPVGAEPYDMPVREGANPVERVVNRVGQEIGAGMVPAGLAVGRAAQLGTEGAAAIQSPIVRSLVERAAAGTPQFLKQEAQAATAAGTGAGLVGEATRAAGYDEHSGVHAAGDLAGALGGLGLFNVAGHAASKIGDVYSALTANEKFANKVTRSEAANQLATAADAPTRLVDGREVRDTSPVVDAIRRGREGGGVGATVPGYKDTLSDVTQDAGIANLEYSRRTAGSPQLARRGAENEKAVNGAIDALAPEGNTDALRSTMAGRRADLQRGAVDETRAAQSRFEEANDRLRTVMEQDARGANIRSALEDAKGAARDRERLAWDGVSDGEADMRPLAERFRQVQGDLSTAERQTLEPQGLTSIPGRHIPADVPAEAGGGLPRGVLDGMDDEERAIAERLMGGNQVGAHPAAEGAAEGAAPQPAMVPLREVTGLRSALSGAQREALSAGNPDKGRVIGRFIDAIDSYAAEHHPNVEAYDRARGVSRDLNDRFTRPQTDVGQVLHEVQGQYRTPHSDVAPRFARPDTGDQGGLEALMREAGNDPRARNAVADQIRADAAGLRSPEAVDRYIAEHGRVLDQFPELRTQLADRSGAQNAAQGAERRAAELDTSLGTETRRGSSTVGRYLDYGPEQSGAAIKGVYSSAKPREAARELLDFAGNDAEAVNGLRRGLWEEAERQARRKGETTANAAGDQPWMPGKLKAFTNDPKVRAVLEEAYKDNPEHLANIDKLNDVLSRANVATRGKSPNASGTAQGMMDVVRRSVSPESIQSGVMSVKRGQIGVPWLVTSIAARIARNSVKSAQGPAITRLLDEALANPEIAEALLRDNNPVNRAYLQRKTKLWVPEHASQIATAINDNDEQDPVKSALQRSRR